MKNPSLRQELRYEPATVIPLKRGESLLEWLENNNRLVHRSTAAEISEDEEEGDEEIAALMGVDGQGFDDDDDPLEDLEE